MKIPQRQDQVGLEAPRTQPGQAAQPIEGSLGDSYVSAMRNLAKPLQELSELQFKLSENAYKGQLNAFDVYVESRTNQYNRDLKLATNKEQIDALYENYAKDIAETGNEVLGNKLYTNWERVKGGTALAGASYTGKLTATELDIKNNIQLFQNTANALNIMAGNAETPEQEKRYRQQMYDLADENVKNGTFTQAVAEQYKRKFDVDLDETIIKRDIESDPEEAIKKLSTNTYAPAVTYPERQKFVRAAEQAVASNSGTSKGVAKYLETDWLERYSSQDFTTENGKIVNKNREIAYKIYDMSTEQPLKAAREYAKQLGIDPNKIMADDAIKFRTFMVQTFDFNDQARNDAFNQAYDSAVETVNKLKTFQSKSDKLSLERNPFAFIAGFNTGDFPNVNSDSMDTMISAYNTANNMFNDTYSRALLAKNGEARAKLQEQNNMIADVIVKDIDKKYFDRVGYYGRMQSELKRIKKELTDGGLLYGNTEVKMRNVVKHLLDNNKVETLFNGKQDDKVVKNAIDSALMYALNPTEPEEVAGTFRVAYGLGFSGTEEYKKLKEGL